MIIPIRCYTCGKVLGNKWEQYQSLLEEGKTPCECLDIIELKKYCCRKNILCHIELIDKILNYLPDENENGSG